MIKVTVKKLAELLHRSDGYTRIILHREGVRMDDFEGVVRIISKYRMREVRKKNGDRYFYEQEIQFERARMLFDELFCKEYFDEIKEQNGNICSECKSSKEINIHHIDFNHFNNKSSNLSVLCWDCHRKLHGTSFGKGSNKVQLLTIKLAAHFLNTHLANIYYWIDCGKLNVYYAKDKTPYVSHRELLECKH